VTGRDPVSIRHATPPIGYTLHAFHTLIRGSQDGTTSPPNFTSAHLSGSDMSSRRSSDLFVHNSVRNAYTKHLCNGCIREMRGGGSIVIGAQFSTVIHRVSRIDIRHSSPPLMNGKRYRVQRYSVRDCKYVPSRSRGQPRCVVDRRADPIRIYRRLGTFCCICALRVIVLPFSKIF
jgi:hypothetical protein